MVKDGAGGVDDGGSAIAAGRRLAAEPLAEVPAAVLKAASRNGALLDGKNDASGAYMPCRQLAGQYRRSAFAMERLPVELARASQKAARPCAFPPGTRPKAWPNSAFLPPKPY